MPNDTHTANATTSRTLGRMAMCALCVSGLMLPMAGPLTFNMLTSQPIELEEEVQSVGETDVEMTEERRRPESPVSTTLRYRTPSANGNLAGRRFPTGNRGEYASVNGIGGPLRC